MSRAVASSMVRSAGFPRVSGDEPALLSVYPNQIVFSPRERG